MLVIGTKPEYFNAVWVKNEWSRFLKIIKKDRTKLLIPCYRDMDAYELPEEFAHLQAQDMAKIGFINDIVRGIKKVINVGPAIAPQKAKPKEVERESVAAPAPTASKTDVLIKRIFLFIEEGDKRKAEEYCEKVLDIDPENAQVYLAKLLIDKKVQTVDGLSELYEPFEDNINYQRAIRYGDESLRNKLEECIRKRKISEENKNLMYDYTKEKILKRAKYFINLDNTIDYKIAIKDLESIRGYRNADELIDFCKQKIQRILK